MTVSPKFFLESAARPLLLKAGIAIIVIGLLVVIIMLASQIFLVSLIICKEEIPRIWLISYQLLFLIYQEENVQVKQAGDV